jgi:hypothetical protein
LLNRAIGDVVRKMEQLEARSPKNELEDLRKDVNGEISLLRSQGQNYKRVLDQQRKSQKDLTAHIDEVLTAHIGRLKAAFEGIGDLVKGLRQVEHQQAIIRSLQFPSIKRRHTEIETAQQDTLEWIFDKSETNFLQWLETGNGIYWINGLVRRIATCNMVNYG